MSAIQVEAAERSAPRKRGDAGSARATPRPPGRPTLSNEQLLDTALKLFLEHGFERTSIDAITAAAGMAKRTVYLRYADKETLFRAALTRAIENWIVPTEALIESETDDLEETLLKIGRILVANIMSPAGINLLRITNAESVRMPEIGAFTYAQGTGRTIAYLADLFRRSLAPATDVEAWREAAIAFLYLVVCGPPTMTAWGMALDEATIDRHTVFGVRLFLHGLLSREPAAGPEEATSAGSEALRTENARLKQLLVAALLDQAALRERLERLVPPHAEGGLTV